MKIKLPEYKEIRNINELPLETLILLFGYVNRMNTASYWLVNHSLVCHLWTDKVIPAAWSELSLSTNQPPDPLVQYNERRIIAHSAGGDRVLFRKLIMRIGKSVDYISALMTVTSVDLRNNPSTNNVIDRLADALKSNTNITSISFYNNRLMQKGGTTICNALQKNTTLTHLDLGLNMLGANGGNAVGGVAFAKALSANRALNTLVLNNNTFSKETLVALGDMLASNSSLTDLGLANNSITADSASALFERLAASNNRSLIRIDLSNNLVGVEGGESIASNISRCNICELLLSNNQLSTTGSMSILKSLPSSIQTIDVSNNAITPTQLASDTLVTLLQKNDTLTKLNISSNKLDDDVVQPLIQSIQSNKSLIHIQIGSNQFSKQSNNKLVDCFRNNKSIFFYDLQEEY
ncbi:hypothetical protein DFA_00953 [Cavenderia fasciculata]|uniref:Leucine-rich repeat-containing protein n=1 Tax=Cavenderia fasciculata TaxID=261658 RepID=F4PUQ9_CACFS|nr:uncharacterized protein DFA_00953 [Cavenderia fasciculata]EGG21078.1 hypothetical protein DFA_00953 [Cavenderia fasciculata]|eukprot:XP_004358928.1 hypothetical protein DFA_00953 [Cavenderia fasciculata]